MSIDNINTVNKIDDFMNDIFIPLLREYKVSDEELESIIQRIVNKLNDSSFINRFDENSKSELINLAVGSGLKYNSNNREYYSGINTAFIKHFEEVIWGNDDKNSYQLQSVSEKLTSEEEGLGNEEVCKYFLTGNGKAFNNYLRSYLSEETIISFDMACNSNGVLPSLERTYDSCIKMIHSKQSPTKDINLREHMMQKQRLSVQKKELLEEKREAVSSFRNQLENFKIDDIKPKTK